MADQVNTQIPLEGAYELSKTQFEFSDMKLGKLEKKKFNEVTRATGILDVPPESRVSVSSYFGGTVKYLSLIPGELVKKGQLLFTLENPDFVQMQQDYLEAKGQLKYLTSDYERQKNLVKDNVTSQKNFLKAESNYTVIRVKVESLAKKLSLMNINGNTLTMENIRTTINIYSPISGYVTKVGVTRGGFLNQSQSAITIVNTDHLHLELSVFEKDLPKVTIGQKIQFSIQDDKSQKYEAVVHLVNKTVDPIDRTIGIHGRLSDGKSSANFSPGMYVEANIFSTSSIKMSLPENALVEVEGKYFALVLQDNSTTGLSFQKREIKAGESSNGLVVILNHEDFNKNTQFLTKGAFNLITE
ncbi:efflux RND transporter periplasmic adaptor subunit [Bacteroidota bacterium]